MWITCDKNASYALVWDAQKNSTNLACSCSPIRKITRSAVRATHLLCYTQHYHTGCQPNHRIQHLFHHLRIGADVGSSNNIITGFIHGERAIAALLLTTRNLSGNFWACSILTRSKMAIAGSQPLSLSCIPSVPGYSYLLVR